MKRTKKGKGREEQPDVLRHLPFVHRCARHFEPMGRALGLEHDDLFQAGCVGLCIAARRFDPARGTNFLTYAVHWIRLEMLQCIRDAQPIRIPRATFGRPPEMPEPSFTSLQEERHDRPDRQDELPDPRPGPEECAVQRDSARAVRTALAKLPAPYRRILERRHGFGSEPTTLEAAGLAYGRSREWARQLQEDAEHALRADSALARLAGQAPPGSTQARGRPTLHGGSPAHEDGPGGQRQAQPNRWP